MSIDERFIAKTKPERKDIQTHIEDLLRNLKILKELYPNLNIDWDMLCFACIYHDLGKMNLKFQLVVHGEGKNTGIPHGLLSLGFIDYNYLEERGYCEKDIKILFHAVAYHHERETDYSSDDIYEEIKTLTDIFKVFEYPKLPTRSFNPEFDKVFFEPGQRFYESKDDSYFFKYVMLKGLLNRIDYAASGEIPVERKNDFLMDSMMKLLDRWKKKTPNSKWNSLQKYMLQHQEENVIVIAQTGMGKTEAGLLWLGNNKGFFTLPLKSAINAIYKRIKEEIVVEEINGRVGLLHSDTLKIYFEQKEKKFNNKNYDNEESDLFLEYYHSTKQLSLPLTICTLDQIFDFVYRYKGFEPKLATLSYSKVIIDEIQMYSPDLVAYLILGLSYITKMGGKYAIMTATLPSLILDFMEQEGLQPPKPKVFTNDLIRHSLKIIDAPIDAEESIMQMANAFSKNKILIICNTIKRAKEVFEKLKSVLEKENKSHIYLLHSGFISSDRRIKEEMIMETGKKGSEKCEIWVSTQIVEASLDIDFDLLFTELSDLNGLFQRMGRCYRHRSLDVDYNCFVFTGGDKGCSGIGSVIESKIYELSKQALKIDGVICEKCKVKMVEKVYSTKELFGTEYYNEIRRTLRYVKDTTEWEYTKQEVNKMFRNIAQTSVIPSTVYYENESKIKKHIDTLKSKTENLFTKIKAREAIREYMVPVSTRLAEETKHYEEDIEKHFKIFVVDADYNSETGISFVKTKNDEFKDIENRIF